MELRPGALVPSPTKKDKSVASTHILTGAVQITKAALLGCPFR
jgi:hypothetical protein